MNDSVQRKCHVLLGMNLVLLLVLLWQFYPVSSDRAQSHYVTSQAASIAISKIRYGLYDGYIGYRNVLKELLKIEGDNDRGIPISRINQAMRRAVNLDDAASGGKHWMPCLPTWSDFVSAAFFIFKINVKSLFYFYMLLLVISLGAFIAAFRRNPESLYLSLMVIITFIVVVNSPAMMTMTRVSHRFWTYLAIIPAFHIAITFMEDQERTRWRLIGVLIQSAILVFIIHCRNVAIYEFIFLFVAVPAYLLIMHAVRSRGVSALIPFIRKHRVWPLVVVLICFAVITVYAKVRLHPDYWRIKTGYPFWHMIYISLSAHPDACSKYGICAFSDAEAYKFVEKKMGTRFDDRIWNDLTIGVNPRRARFIVFFSPVYSDILRSEVLRIIREDPGFFLSSFYYKMSRFPAIYWVGCEGVGGYVSPVHVLYNGSLSLFGLRWILILMAAGGFCLAKRSSWWFGNLSIAMLMFVSCFAMLMVAYPHYSTIMDPAFTLTLVMYIIVSALLYYLGAAVWNGGRKIKRSTQKNGFPNVK